MNSPLSRSVRAIMLALILALALARPASAAESSGPSILRDTETEWLFRDIAKPLISAANLNPRSVNVILIGPLGFIVAATTLFFCVARAFGSDRPLRDLGIGLAIAVVAYLGFDRLLGISLGLGTLWGGG